MFNISLMDPNRFFLYEDELVVLIQFYLKCYIEVILLNNIF